MTARRRGARGFERGARPCPVRCSNSGRTRFDSRGSMRIDRFASHGTRSRVSTPHNERIAEQLRRFGPALGGDQRPLDPVRCFGLLNRPTHPPAIPPECPDGVAIGADKLALRDLDQDLLFRTTPKCLTDVADLLELRQVVPLHDLRGKDASTVGAWSSGLQRSQPGRAWSRVTGAGPAGDGPTDPALVLLVTDFGAASRAIDLQAVSSSQAAIEARTCLGEPAANAVFHALNIIAQMFY